MAGVSELNKKAILDQFPFDTGTLSVRYLGLPLLTNRLTVNDYVPLIKIIRTRIISWTAKHLSFAGRLQLTSSVIHSLTNFWISAFILPKGCIHEIDKLCSAFLWSRPYLNLNKAKIAWQDVCKPKEEGGLGLRTITEANKVSCLKLIWKLLSSHSSLWVNWIRHYLIRKGSFWLVKTSTSLYSWTWKNLLKFRDLAAPFVKVEIQNGHLSSFWYDVWSPLGILIDLTGPRDCIDLGIGIHSSVADALLHQRRRHRNTILNNIEDAIQKQQEQSTSLGDDEILWR